MIQVGTIKRDQLRYLPLLEHIHELPLKNDELKFATDWFTAHIPANFKATRTKDASGNTRIDFTPHPNITAGVLSQDCKAVVIGKDRITLELPFAPDVYFAVED